MTAFKEQLILSIMRKFYAVFILVGVSLFSNSNLYAQCTSGPDTDGDGVFDICDLDDDNDGILDTDECFGTQRFTYTNFANAGGGGGTINYPTGWILSPVGSGLNGIGTKKHIN